jgi:hypothetical protein
MLQNSIVKGNAEDGLVKPKHIPRLEEKTMKKR